MHRSASPDITELQARLTRCLCEHIHTRPAHCAARAAATGSPSHSTTHVVLSKEPEGEMEAEMWCALHINLPGKVRERSSRIDNHTVGKSCWKVMFISLPLLFLCASQTVALWRMQCAE